MSTLHIIQFQICLNVERTKDTELVGLGLDGVVYTYDFNEKHWNPLTSKRVNPLHKQPKKQEIIIKDERDKGDK